MSWLGVRECERWPDADLRDGSEVLKDPTGTFNGQYDAAKRVTCTYPGSIFRKEPSWMAKVLGKSRRAVEGR